jgi:3-oxoacyl-(acyl-carrier-protein) synthase
MIGGVSRVRRAFEFDTAPFKSKVVAAVDFALPPTDYADRHIRLAVLAADEAVAESSLPQSEPPLRTGIVFATAVGATIRMEQGYRRQAKEGSDAFYFDTATRLLESRYHAHHLGLTITTGCTAGLDAVGAAFDAINMGWVDRAIVVAADAPISPITMAAFDRIGAISRFTGAAELASRPFHSERDGFVLAEGAAALVLESPAAAANRGAAAIAVMEGWASVSSAFHMTAIRSTGQDIARAMRGALASADRRESDIDFLDLHATSTRQNDLAESAAVNEVFAANGEDIPVMAQKSINGHALGASSLLEVVNAITSLQRGLLLPTANLDNQDPLCRIAARATTVSGRFKRFLKSASGFSGIHTCAVFAKA